MRAGFVFFISPPMTDEELDRAIAALPGKLDYFKRWRQNEYDLLNQRVTSFITCQSFLLTAYAVSYVNSPGANNWFSRILLPALGIMLSVVIVFPIRYSILTVDSWMIKHWDAVDGLWREIETRPNPEAYRPAMTEYLIRSDYEELLPTGRYKETKNRDSGSFQFWRNPSHWYGLLFARTINLVFLGTWAIAVVWTCFNSWR